ncbi:MAG: family 10 glycosylhydrolase [Planctomycetes bacterium]|nr:family 10 glycosylhydrolase [Planctomycetota bacterium]
MSLVFPWKIRLFAVKRSVPGVFLAGVGVTWGLLFGLWPIFSRADQPGRFIYNCDAGNMFVFQQPPMQPEDIYRQIDIVAEAGVTTFSMCPNVGMVMNFPSKHVRMLGDEGDAEIQTLIKAEGVKKSGNARAALNFRSLVEAGHDPLALVLNRAKQKSMEVFLSFRVNEVHGVDNPETFSHRLILSKFWNDHPEWKVGKQGGTLSPLHQEILGPRTNPIVGKWFAGGLNFAIPEVRQRRLDQLCECCERYDIDGLELDFQRFPVFFKYGEEEKHLPTMTKWIREVRDMTREVGKKRGRPILLSARILARPEQNLGIGLDPISWAREGLLDFVIVSHYLHNNFPLPIKEYRRLLPHDMPLYASIEVERDAGKYREIAKQLYSDGVDGLLMFNFFTSRERGQEPDFKLLKELSNQKTILPVAQ